VLRFVSRLLNHDWIGLDWIGFISWSFIFGFYLSVGIPQILLEVIFVAVIVLTAHCIEVLIKFLEEIP